MAGQIDRRTAVAAAGMGALGLTALLAQSASASHSSGAGVVAGGSLAGSAGDIQFSAFGSVITYDDGHEPSRIGTLAWYDPAGLDGEPVNLTLVTVSSYGPGETEDTRVLTGTLSVNGEGEAPFSLTLVDAGPIGEGGDAVHLAVGPDAAGDGATPMATADFVYEASGELTAGDVQIFTTDF
jgi:hypothetical protein